MQDASGPVAAPRGAVLGRLRDARLPGGAAALTTGFAITDASVRRDSAGAGRWVSARDPGGGGAAGPLLGEPDTRTRVVVGGDAEADRAAAIPALLDGLPTPIRNSARGCGDAAGEDRAGRRGRAGGAAAARPATGTRKCAGVSVRRVARGISVPFAYASVLIKASSFSCIHRTRRITIAARQEPLREQQQPVVAQAGHDEPLAPSSSRARPPRPPTAHPPPSRP